MDAFAHYKPIEIDEDSLPEVDADEVAKHNTADDLWVIVYGRVYDVTEWQHSHPGGDFILQEYGGKDASNMFRSVQHSRDALGIRNNFMIARLKKTTDIPAAAPKPKSSMKSTPSQKSTPVTVASQSTSTKPVRRPNSSPAQANTKPVSSTTQKPTTAAKPSITRSTVSIAKPKPIPKKPFPKNSKL